MLVPANQGTVYITDMNTLSDVDIRRGGTDPLNAGLTSDVLPKAQSSLTGVSVRYAPDPDKQWFVLRVTYNRISKVYNYFSQDNTEAYFPTHYVQKTLQGKKKRVLAPLLPNILFVYASSEKVETYVKHTPDLPFLTYYYDHFRTINGKNPPLTIPYDTMMNFIRLTSVVDDIFNFIKH